LFLDVQPRDVRKPPDHHEQQRRVGREPHVEEQPGGEAVDVDGDALASVQQSSDFAHPRRVPTRPSDLIREPDQPSHPWIGVFLQAAVGLRLAGALVEAVAVAPDALPFRGTPIKKRLHRFAAGVEFEQFLHRQRQRAEVVGAHRGGDEADGGGGEGCADARGDARPVGRGRCHAVLAERDEIRVHHAAFQRCGAARLQLEEEHLDEAERADEFADGHAASEDLSVADEAGAGELRPCDARWCGIEAGRNGCFEGGGHAMLRESRQHPENAGPAAGWDGECGCFMLLENSDV
jgi:hypothetical protein